MQEDTDDLAWSSLHRWPESPLDCKTGKPTQKPGAKVSFLLNEKSEKSEIIETQLFNF